MYRYFLALRYLLSRPINLLGVIGITLGVWALIVVVAIFSGYLAVVKKHVVGTTSDLTAILLPDDIGYERFREAILADPNVAACSPRIIWFGLLHPEERKEAPGVTNPGDEKRGSASGVPGADGNFVTIVGVDAAAERGTSDLSDWLRAAPEAHRVRDFERPFAGSRPGMVVSLPRAEHHGLVIGDPVRLASARMLSPPGKPQVLDLVEARFEITGCFESEYAGFDGLTVYADIAAMRSAVTGKEAVDWVTEIAIRVRDRGTLDDTRARLNVALNRLLKRHHRPILVSSPERLNAGQLANIEHQRALMRLVLLIIMIVAAFLLFATLSMMVTEKTHDIGILTAIGATPGGVMTVFLACGLAISVCGAVLGVVTGCLSAIYTDAFNSWMRDWFDVDLFPTRIYSLKHVPCELDPSWIASVAGIAVGLGVLVSAIPAWRAARHDPLQSLREE